MSLDSAVAAAQQAVLAVDWEDAVGPSYVRLAAHVPDGLTPNTKSMYRMQAMIELEKAIERARYVEMETPLVASDLSPRVYDLLMALGAAQFEANAHNMLGNLACWS